VCRARLDWRRDCWRLALCLAIALAPACSGGPAPAPGGFSGPIGSLEDAPSRPPGRPDQVILVSVSGLTPDLYLERATPMPVLADLARAGVAAEFVESVVPATVYPVHTSLVTGRPPNDHGVPADQMLGDHGVRRARYWHASHVQGATLWQSAIDARIGVAALDWPATVGAAIPLLWPDILPTRRGERWIDLLAETATPWLLQIAQSSPEELAASGRPGARRDALLVDLACKVVASEPPPGLILLRLSQTDPVLHTQAPHSQQVREAFARVDADLDRLLGCLEETGSLASTAIVVVGDRAVLPVHTAVRPNFVLAQAGLLSVGASGPIRSWSAVVRSNGGSAFVYAREERSARGARNALEAEAEHSGAYRIVSADEMIRRDADSEAWFGLDARPGFAFDDSARGPLLRPSERRAAGGYLEPRPDLGPGFVAYGRGVRRNLRIPEIDQLDIAPTIAKLRGLELPGARGRAFVGVLRLPADPRSAETAGGASGGDLQ
jgi:predicted AlkP superfamily pyrophosphatase or phosphodiesterase